MSSYRTQQSFAKALGVTKGTMSKYLARPDWPAPRKPPFSDEDLQRVRAWRNLLQEDRSGKADAPPAPPVGSGINLKELAARQKILLDKERTRKAKVDADMAEANVVPRVILDRALVGLTRAFVEKWRNAEHSLPRQLDGNRQANQKAVRAYADRACQDLIDTAEILLASTDDEMLTIVRRRSRSRSIAGTAAADAAP